MIWVTGSKGMLGTELSLLLDKLQISYIATGHEVDITNAYLLNEFAEKQNKIRPITWIINCAAYTGVDNAEEERELCHIRNVVGPAYLSTLSKEIGAKLIHISTDYVFNGKANRPYIEDDITDPLGIYGLTKREGEIKVLENNLASYIIRTSWLYGKYGKNFVLTMLKMMKERNTIAVVNDQRGSPTWTFDLANTIIMLVKSVDNKKSIPCGLYHYSHEGDITWFEFAQEIYAQGRKIGILNKDCIVNSCLSIDFPSKAKRPVYSVLDKTKIKRQLDIDIPVWDISLNKFLYNFLIK